MASRCKVKCTEVVKQLWGDKQIVYSSKLVPVYGDSPENKAFYAATPGGQLSLATTSNEHFEVGKDYYVDFTPVDVAPVENVSGS